MIVIRCSLEKRKHKRKGGGGINGGEKRTGRAVHGNPDKHRVDSS